MSKITNKISRLFTGSPALDRNFQQIENVVNGLVSNSLQHGVFLEASLTAASSTAVNHMLGRPLQGWIIVDISAAASVWKSSSTNNVLNLQTSADCNVKLYIF